MSRKYPQDRAFLMLDGVAVPVEDIPPDEWAVYEEIMLKNVGKAVSDYYAAKIERGQL